MNAFVSPYPAGMLLQPPHLSTVSPVKSFGKIERLQAMILLIPDTSGNCLAVSSLWFTFRLSRRLPCIWRQKTVHVSTILFKSDTWDILLVICKRLCKTNLCVVENFPQAPQDQRQARAAIYYQERQKGIESSFRGNREDGPCCIA